MNKTHEILGKIDMSIQALLIVTLSAAALAVIAVTVKLLYYYGG